MSSIPVRLIRGGLAGSLAAACMTVIRMAAHRRGVIEKTVPQAAEESLSHRLRLGQDAHPIVHHVTDQVMHIGYGAALGAAYALTARSRSRHVTARGLAYGIGTWLFGSWLLLPRLRAKQAPWRKRPSENIVDLLAHLVFGAATALVSEELAAQSDRGPSSDSARRSARVG